MRPLRILIFDFVNEELKLTSYKDGKKERYAVELCGYDVGAGLTLHQAQALHSDIYCALQTFLKRALDSDLARHPELSSATKQAFQRDSARRRK